MVVRHLLAAVAVAAVSLAPVYAGDAAKKSTAAAKSDIVDVAVGAGSFTTLVAAVQAAGLESVLRGAGPFTVFAPTDAAFAALPAGTVDNLLKPENKDQLVSILTYHVVAGKTKSADLVGKSITVETVNGAGVAIDGASGVKVGGANVVSADIYASNGVIHVIDAVLLPPSSSSM